MQCLPIRGSIFALSLLCFHLTPLPAAAAPLGAVATGDARATAVATAVLAEGGNAVDAAVAAALTLAVVYPEAGNLGGGGFAVVRSGDGVFALDFREVAPEAARPDMYLDAEGKPIPGASLHGPLAAGVPGSPAGYFELHRRFGALPWKRIVAPAIALARDGFAISDRTARTLAEKRDLLALFPETRARFLPGGVPLGAGTRLAAPDLAATLERFAEQGPAGLVQAAAAAVERASRAHGGVLSAADLAAYRAVWREPLRFERLGWSFAAMPLPSSGGVIVGEALGLLERLDWGATARDSAERAQRLIEAFRRAFADRFPLADPSTTEATPDDLLSSVWLDRRAAGIALDHATPSASIRPFPDDARPEPHETTNVSVVDASGRAVALTTTLNSLYGCGLWVGGFGFLNDEMDDFTTVPGRANDFGLVQGDANAVGPGKRPLSSMTPLVAWRGDEVLATGGRGGSRIPTAVVQVLLALQEGDEAAAAVARPRIHHQWLPERVEIEDGALPTAALAKLRTLGYDLEPTKPTDLPKVNLARRLADGSYEAAGDPRADERAAVVTAPERGVGR